MHRRDLLKWSALSGVSASGCASLLSNPGAVGPDQLGAFLSALDETMAGLGAREHLAPWLPAGASVSTRARAAANEDLVRKTLRSMFLVGTLGELPAEQQAQEGVQRRIGASMEEFDDVVFGMTSLLENLSPSERASVSKVLREDPNVGMRIMGTLDDEAGRFGISPKQRLKLRGVAAQACSRLRQGPELVIDEYTAKVRKLEARHGAQAALERAAAANLGSALLFAEDTEGRGTVGGVQPGEGTGIPCDRDSDCSPGQFCSDAQLGGGTCHTAPPKKDRRTSHTVLTVGGITMGVALTGFLGVWLIGGATGTSALIGATVGVLLGIIGLIILIVGLIILATGH